MALVEVEMNMMGNGRMASAPPAEGADPAAMTDRWAYTTGHRQARTALIYTSRQCSGSAAELRDQRLLSTDGLRLHISTFPPPTALSSSSHYSCVCFPCWWDL